MPVPVRPLSAFMIAAALSSAACTFSVGIEGTELAQPLVPTSVTQSPAGGTDTSQPVPTETPSLPGGIESIEPAVFPIPLLPDVEGAAGWLIYAAHTGEPNPAAQFATALMAVPLDASGAPAGAPQLWREWLGYTHAGMYVMPDHRHLVEIDAFEAGSRVSMVDLVAGEGWTISDSPDASYPAFLGWTAEGIGLLHSVVVEGLTFQENRSWIALTRRGGTSVLLDDLRTALASIAVSPDGQTLLYSSYADDASPASTWRLSTRDGAPQRVLDGTAIDLAWSPDGEWIAFKLDHRVHIMRPDGSELEQVADIRTWDIFEPLIWSPGSDALAFVGVPPGTSPWARDWDALAFQYQAYVAEISPEGVGDVREVMPDSQSGYIDPSWSSDGQWLLVVGPSVERPDVWLVSRDAQSVRQITTDGGTKRYPVWVR